MTEKEFVEMFLNVFAKGITEKQRRKNHIGGNRKGYLWNLFGYNLIPCLEKDKARYEYDKADKAGAVEVLYDSPYPNPLKLNH